MAKKAAKVGDKTKGSFTKSWCKHPIYDDDGNVIGKEHPGGVVNGVIKTGSPNVFINGKPAARVGDSVAETSVCTNGTGKITEGSKTVFVNGKPKARLADNVDEHTDVDGKVTTSSNNVFIG